jgi:hypothetical protein
MVPPEEHPGWAALGYFLAAGLLCMLGGGLLVAVLESEWYSFIYAPIAAIAVVLGLFGFVQSIKSFAEWFVS